MLTRSCENATAVSPSSARALAASRTPRPRYTTSSTHVKLCEMTARVREDGVDVNSGGRSGMTGWVSEEGQGGLTETDAAVIGRDDAVDPEVKARGCEQVPKVAQQ